MLNLFCIAGGGAAGALLRYWMTGAVHALLGRGFPYGTLAVNASGSVLIGVCFVFLLERTNLAGEWRSLLMTGLLGAFTTFSTFSLETILLIQAGEQGKAALNVALGVLLCLLGCWAGMVIARQI